MSDIAEKTDNQPIDEGLGRVSQSCQSHGGKPKMKKDIIMYLCLSIEMWVIGGIVSFVAGAIGVDASIYSLDPFSVLIGGSIAGIIALIFSIVGLVFLILMIIKIVQYSGCTDSK